MTVANFDQCHFAYSNDTWYVIKLGSQGHSTLSLMLQQQQQPFNDRLSGTTRVGRYQKKHSPTHTHPGQCTSFITFLQLQQSTVPTAWTYSNQFEFWPPQLHLHPHSTCHPGNKTLSTNSNFALAPISTLVRTALITGFRQPLQMNDFATFDMLP